MSVLARQQESSAPGSVYVQPHLVFLANVRDLVDRIERAEHGRARGGCDEERYVPFGLPFQYEPLQFGRYHAAPRIVQDARANRTAEDCSKTNRNPVDRASVRSDRRYTIKIDVVYMTTPHSPPWFLSRYAPELNPKN